MKVLTDYLCNSIGCKAVIVAIGAGGRVFGQSPCEAVQAAAWTVADWIVESLR
jgi:hypothetical protein